MNKTFMITKKALLIFLLCLCSVAFLWITFNVLYNKQDSLQQHIKAMEQEHQVLYHQMNAPAPTASGIESLSSSSAIWRAVQERVQNTVVQIFVQAGVTDILQPYKSPIQNSMCGSGFFFNEEGDILTNAHVIIQALSVWIQIPEFGKQIFDTEVIGMCPDRDVAILRLNEEGREIIRKKLGSIPYLEFGDSDFVRRSDEVLVLGYPLGMQSLMSTNGIVSGRQGNFIQTDAAINPGNSGGPLLNMQGKVVGINSRAVFEANNVGYAIPINEVARVINDMYKTKILPKSFLGAVFSHANASMAEYFGNPAPGGYYVVEVLEGGIAQKAGMKSGDMLYEFDGHEVDIYGEMSVPWSEDKISIPNYMARLASGDVVHMVVYRKGERKELQLHFDFSESSAIKTVYPEYEELDYEIFGGLVVMELTMNHIRLLAEYAPGLTLYSDFQKRNEKVLIITHVFSTGLAYRLRMISVGNVLRSVNEIPVTTLQEYRAAIKSVARDQFLRLIFIDNVSRVSENLLVVLPMKEVIAQERRLARENRYQMTQLAKDIEAMGDLSVAM